MVVDERKTKFTALFHCTYNLCLGNDFQSKIRLIFLTLYFFSNQITFPDTYWFSGTRGSHGTFLFTNESNFIKSSEFTIFGQNTNSFFQNSTSAFAWPQSHQCKSWKNTADTLKKYTGRNSVGKSQHGYHIMALQWLSAGR